MSGLDGLSDSRVLKNARLLAAEVIRPPLRLNMHDLVAGEQASAIAKEPLEKIRHVCEAIFMLSEREKERAMITREDETTVNEMYGLVLPLLYPHIEKFVDDSGRLTELSTTIPWPFPPGEATLNLEWTKGVKCAFHARTTAEKSEREREIRDAATPAHETYIITSGRTTLDTLARLRWRFCTKYMPIAVRLMRKLMDYISPDPYTRLQILNELGGNEPAIPTANGDVASTTEQY